MKFWISFIGYQAVWLGTVIGAGHALTWPGVLGFTVYATWQLASSRQRKADVLLMLAAIVLGMVLDGGLFHAGLLSYAPAWPAASAPPVWILILWATFALTFTQSLKYLQTRLWLAMLLGTVGGPLAYLAAAHSWQVVRFAQPKWPAVLWLAIGWGLATPLLAWLAARWTRTATPLPVALQEHTP